MSVSSTALTALAAAGRAADAAAEGVARAMAGGAASGVLEPSGDTVSLSEQAVRLVVAQRQFEAAVELAETADEIARESLDLLA